MSKFVKEFEKCEDFLNSTNIPQSMYFMEFKEHATKDLEDQTKDLFNILSWLGYSNSVISHFFNLTHEYATTSVESNEDLYYVLWSKIEKVVDSFEGIRNTVSEFADSKSKIIKEKLEELDYHDMSKQEQVLVQSLILAMETKDDVDNICLTELEKVIAPLKVQD